MTVGWAVVLVVKITSARVSISALDLELIPAVSTVAFWHFSHGSIYSCNILVLNLQCSPASH